MKESALGKQLQIHWSKLGHRLFRFNTGKTWTGDKAAFYKEWTTLSVAPGTVVIPNARVFHSGFEGAADFWGFKRVVITPEMVGQTIAQFAVMETKSPRGKPTTEQKAFIDMVNANGGIGRIVKSIDDSLT